MKEERDYNCNVVGERCRGGTLCMCYACGMPACKKCSSIINYLRYGRRRVCNKCQEEREEELGL